MHDGKIAADPDGSRPGAGLPFNAGSGNGDIRAPLVEAGRGLDADYARLGSARVAVRGKIVLMPDSPDDLLGSSLSLGSAKDRIHDRHHERVIEKLERTRPETGRQTSLVCIDNWERFQLPFHLGAKLEPLGGAAAGVGKGPAYAGFIVGLAADVRGKLRVAHPEKT
ncbi:MAG: hypothetical protein WAK88_01840 [Candidatus Cybelea sp.]